MMFQSLAQLSTHSALFGACLVSLHSVCAQSVVENQINQPDAFIQFQAVLLNEACTISLKSKGNTNPYVLNLPSMLSTNLNALRTGPLNRFVVQFDIIKSGTNCNMDGNNMFNLLFDPSVFDNILAKNGFLNNTATYNPATNVMVQIGIMGDSGQYTPINLTQPQWVKFMTSSTNNLKPVTEMNLGIRYVSMETVTTLSGLPTSNKDLEVKPGNVSVRLPFLLNFN